MSMELLVRKEDTVTGFGLWLEGSHKLRFMSGCCDAYIHSTGAGVPPASWSWECAECHRQLITDETLLSDIGPSVWEIRTAMKYPDDFNAWLQRWTGIEDIEGEVLT